MRSPFKIMLAGAGALLSIAGLAGCGGGTAVRQVDTAAAIDLIDQGVKAVDVREPSEYTGGHIPGVALVPLGAVESASAGWDKDEPILLVCRSGNRSMQAAEILRKKGFTKLYNLKKGMMGWSGRVVGGPARGEW